MAVRTTPSNAINYENFMARLAELRNYLVSQIATMAAGPIKGETIIQDSNKFAMTRDQITAFLARPNIVQDVKDYENDQSYDVSAAVQPTQTEIAAAITMINQAFPEDEETGYKLVGKLENGYWVSRTFGVAASAPLRDQYQAIVDTIEEPQ